MATKKSAAKATPKKATSAKAIVNKMFKTEQINLQFDPKNREVYLFQVGDLFQVTKPGTQYASDLLNEDEATIAFQFQIGCSQN